MGTFRLIVGLILSATWIVVPQGFLTAQERQSPSPILRTNYSSRVSHAPRVAVPLDSQLQASLTANLRVNQVNFSDQPTTDRKSSVSYSRKDNRSGNTQWAPKISLTNERSPTQSVTFSDQQTTSANPSPSPAPLQIQPSDCVKSSPNLSHPISAGATANLSDSNIEVSGLQSESGSFTQGFGDQNRTSQTQTSHAYRPISAEGISSRRQTRQASGFQSLSTPDDHNLVASQRFNTVPMGSAPNASLANDAPANANTVRLQLGDISAARFADPKSFLKDKSFKFANPDLFLKPQHVTADNHHPQNSSVPSRLTSNQKRNPRQDDRLAEPSKRGGDEEMGRLTIADVQAPISFNPFGEIEQVDDQGLLNRKSRPMFGYAPSDTYAELTGQYFQVHNATWKAHHLYHKPLYFEEANLERYGNQLRFQNVVSSIHFFTSAALLPYKLGQTPPNTCITTLGHHRPGECVPYQMHCGELSKKGIMLQALPIIAISL